MGPSAQGQDCAGVCGGSAELDNCSLCGGDGSTCCDNICGGNEPDCDGAGTCICAAEYDCWGVCGGPAANDECGVCDEDSSNDCILDCTEVWGGDAVVDACGNCDGACYANDEGFVTCGGGYYNPSNIYIADCNGVCEGIEGSLINICIGGVTGAVNQTDCEDTGGYWSEDGVDECGECGGDGTMCLSLYDGLIPDKYSIQNIYPNPFNPVTNIEFALPKNAYVDIKIYNINGREIETLMNSFQLAGYYTINWNASKYSSGVYFVVMTSALFKQTKQVVLMK